VIFQEVVEKLKSDARTRAHSQSFAKQEASLLNFARSAFGVRCVRASLSSADVTTNLNSVARLARETRELTQIFQSIY
jgi:hypothetical protein